jgi:hypothetical protein
LTRIVLPGHRRKMELVRTPFVLRRMLVRAFRRPRRGPRRVSVLLVGLVLIAAWQKDFFTRASDLDNRYTHRESTGMNQEWRFVYFLYYMGLVPVVTTEGHARMKGEAGYNKFERAAAERVIAQSGETLSMEAGQTVRAGDLGRILLYLPYAFWSGDTRDPKLAPTHAAVFTFALGALYAAFWWARDPILGGASVALLGSNPYQLFEVHARENIFSWGITAGVLTLALSLPLLRGERGRWAWLLPLAMGVLLASVRQIRPEPVAIAASAGLACLLVPRASWLRRAALAALLVAAFVATSLAWQVYFDRKFEQATRVVAAAGGRTYHGPRDRYHTFWHPLWCGLGDFGEKHGYEWRDKAARALRRSDRAGPLPRARKRTGLAVPVLGPRLQRGARGEDPLRHHPRPDLVPRGSRAAHREGLHLDDPRAAGAGPWWATLPWSGLATVPLLLALGFTRSWTLLKVACFPLGTSLPAILVFSGTVPGQTYVSWFHIIAAAIVLSGLIDVSREVLQRSRRARRSASSRSTIRP